MRLISIALIGLFILLQGKLWLGQGGARDVFRLEAAVETNRAENMRRVELNAELAAEVLNLKQGYEAIEERARSELGMIGEGETFYQLVEKSGASH